MSHASSKGLKKGQEVLVGILSTKPQAATTVAHPGTTVYCPSPPQSLQDMLVTHRQHCCKEHSSDSESKDTCRQLQPDVTAFPVRLRSIKSGLSAGDITEHG
jgi:hypothetical protein